MTAQPKPSEKLETSRNHSYVPPIFDKVVNGNIYSISVTQYPY